MRTMKKAFLPKWISHSKWVTVMYHFRKRVQGDWISDQAKVLLTVSISQSSNFSLLIARTKLSIESLNLYKHSGKSLNEKPGCMSSERRRGIYSSSSDSGSQVRRNIFTRSSCRTNNESSSLGTKSIH